MRCLSFLFKSILCFVPCFALAIPPSYEVIDLGSFGGTSSALGLNPSGELSGQLLAVGSAEGVFRHPDGFLQPSTRPVFFQDTFVQFSSDFLGDASAFAVNDNQVAVGIGSFLEEIERVDPETGETLRAFVFTNERTAVLTNGFVERLDLGEDILSSRGLDINNDGWIVGFGNAVTLRASGVVLTTGPRGYVFNPVSRVATIVPPSSGDLTRALAINENRDFIGITTARNEDGERVQWGFIAEASNPEELTLIRGLEGRIVDVNDLNNKRVVVGRSSFTDEPGRVAFMYDVDSQQTTEIGFLNNELRQSNAVSINNNNEVIGVSQVTVNPVSLEPFIYDGISMQNLNELIDCNNGWFLADVRKISDDGYIVGTGVVSTVNDNGTQEGVVRGFLLKPRDVAPNRSCLKNGDFFNNSGSFGFYFTLMMLCLLGIRLKSNRP